MGENKSALMHLLAKRKDRSIAIILTVKERDCDKHLPEHASLRLRKVILDQLNEMYSMMIDVADSLDAGDVTLNEMYLTKLDAIYEAVTREAVEVT